MSFLNDYDLLYAFKLGRRADTFRSVFSHLLEAKPNNVTIVETGMINDPGNWNGHGQSTILFDELTKAVGGMVFSVDISPNAVDTTRGLVSNKVFAVHGNSLHFLTQFNQPIDLLYLDSFDLDHDDPAPAAAHCLFEFVAASRNLHTGSIVAIDDTWWLDNEAPFGKGMLVCPCMQALGHERITDPKGAQVAWVLK